MITGESRGLYKGIDLSPELNVQDQGVVAFLQDAYAIDPKIEGECLTKIYNSRPNNMEKFEKFKFSRESN